MSRCTPAVASWLIAVTRYSTMSVVAGSYQVTVPLVPPAVTSAPLITLPLTGGQVAVPVAVARGVPVGRGRKPPGYGLRVPVGRLGPADGVALPLVTTIHDLPPPSPSAVFAL